MTADGGEAPPQAHSSRELLALMLGLVAVSTSAIFIRLCHSAPDAIAFWRLAGAGAVMLALSVARGKSLRLERRELVAALGGAALLTAHFYFWMASLFMTSINSSVVLLATQPLFALLLQWLLRRGDVNRRNVLSLLFGMIGAAVIAGSDLARSTHAGLGDLFSIISAAFAAGYLTVGSLRRGALLPFLAVLYSAAAAMMALITVVRRDAFVPADQKEWGWLLLLVLIPTLIGHTLLNRATRHFPTYAVNLSILAEPPITSLFAAIVFAEWPGTNVWLGGVMIIAAVAAEFVPWRATTSFSSS